MLAFATVRLVVYFGRYARADRPSLIRLMIPIAIEEDGGLK